MVFPVIAPCNYRPVIKAVITVITTPGLSVTSNCVIRGRCSACTFTHPAAGRSVYALVRLCGEAISSSWMCHKDATKDRLRAQMRRREETRESKEEENEAVAWRAGCREGELEGEERAACRAVGSERGLERCAVVVLSPRWLLGLARAFQTRYQLLHGQQCCLHSLWIIGNHRPSLERHASTRQKVSTTAS